MATVRALKMHGGGPTVKPGMPLDEAYIKENLPLVEKGCENLVAHIETVKKAGVRPVVCINSFHTDTKAEIELVRRIARGERGAGRAVGALAEGRRGRHRAGRGCGRRPARRRATSSSSTTWITPLRKRIELIAKEVYGADGVTYSDEALEKAKTFEADPAASKLGTCMVKTHLSLSHDPDVKGRPKGWELPIRDILLYKGAGFIVPVAGAIKLMPGTGSNPAFRRHRRRRQDRKGEGPVLGLRLSWRGRASTRTDTGNGKASMTARIIDGKQVADEMRAELKAEVARLKPKGIVPGLGVILVGEDPASRPTCTAKERPARRSASTPTTTACRRRPPQEELMALVQRMNARSEDQRHPGPAAAAQAHQRGRGAAGHRPGQGRGRLPPDERRQDGGRREGVPALHAARRGPVAAPQRRQASTARTSSSSAAATSSASRWRTCCIQKSPTGNATVTVCHTRTKDLAYHTRQADIVIAAAGRPNTITADMVREGAVVIDVGVNRVEDATKKSGYPAGRRRRFRGGEGEGVAASRPCPAASAR